MKTVEKISTLTGQWFPLIVLIAAGIALATPGTFSGWGPAVPWMLATIMLGMGMTLRPIDFAVIAKRPWALLLGVALQYSVMPLLGWGLAQLFGFNTMLTIGMILVGAAPGGTASNVMVYIAKGDAALSVAMTTVSTLLAPVMTPLLILWLVGEDLPVGFGDLFESIMQVVLVPVLLGLVLRLAIPRVIEKILPVLPLISVLGITGVVVTVVAGNSATLLDVGLVVVLAVILHNVGGLALGYAVAAGLKIPVTVRRAVSIEVGMQNSGLAATLATVHFAPAAALPAALFSVWHNVSGSLLAGFWSRKPVPSTAEIVDGAAVGPSSDVEDDPR